MTMELSMGHSKSLSYAQIIMITVLLSGCANVIPSYDIPEGINNKPTIESIVIRTECELLDIIDPKLSKIVAKTALYNDVFVGVELNLSVTADGGLAPTFSYLNGPLTVATGFTLDQSREQTFTEQLFFSLRDLNGVDRKYIDCSRPADTNLSGRLGLKEAYDLSLTAGPAVNWNASGDSGVFTNGITFTVNKELNATGPTWKLTHFSGPGSFLTASEKNVDKITFAFKKGEHVGQGVPPFVVDELKEALYRHNQNQISLSLITLANGSR